MNKCCLCNKEINNQDYLVEKRMHHGEYMNKEFIYHVKCYQVMIISSWWNTEENKQWSKQFKKENFDKEHYNQYNKDQC